MSAVQIRKIFVSKVAGIGDVVLATPILAGLKKMYPQAHLTFMVLPNARDAVEGLPFIDRVFVHEPRKDSAWTVFQAMRGADLALLLDLRYKPALLAWLARIPFRVGISHKRKSWLNRPVDWEERLDHQYEPDVFAEILSRGTGMALPAEEVHTLHFAEASEKERRQVDQMLASHGIGPKDAYLTCSPVTAHHLKDWPLENWERLFIKLWRQDGLRTVWFGGGEPLTQELPEGIVDLRGRTSLRQAGYLVKNCTLLVNSCSLPVHMAAAFHTPSVLLYGFTDSRRWAPRENCKIVSAGLDCSPCDGYRGSSCVDPVCMRKISVDEVYAACKSVLNNR